MIRFFNQLSEPMDSYAKNLIEMESRNDVRDSYNLETKTCAGCFLNSSLSVRIQLNFTASLFLWIPLLGSIVKKNYYFCRDSEKKKVVYMF